ncbi:DNA-binding protein HEXBP-like [Helianthus annuus]|uniref:DNA-binding protein HEXBP-like n=1 Tax=Helianthus annuus TaxID=4232 RepID=UPI000B8F1978|nr:DNA-binding protein HEXBP-like [Helianthus annuus]
MDHKTQECKDLKDATCYGCGEKRHIKTRCPKKATKGKGTLDSQAKPCGICNKEGHKALECQGIKDATCYGCNEIGHIKTNCPNKTKKPGEAKKTKVGDSQMNAQEVVQDDNITTAVRKAMRKVMKRFKKPNAACFKTHVAAHEKSYIHTSNAKNKPNKSIYGKEPHSFLGCT